MGQGQCFTEVPGNLGTAAAEITHWDATVPPPSELNKALLPSASVNDPLQGTSHAAALILGAALMYRTSNTGKPLGK